MKKLNWNAFSDKPRLEVIDQVKDALSKNGGCIMNFNMFSDLALALSVEVEEDQIIKLHSALGSILKVSDLDWKQTIGNSKREWMVFINISFKQGKGNLKADIPAVPG